MTTSGSPINRSNGLELTVVVPVHNEEGNVDPLLERIVSALDLFELEIIYVDDGSTDATPQRLAAAMLVHPQLRVIRHTRNSGQSTALHTGVRAARAPWIATLDGDGQNDPSDIPRLLGILESAEPTQHAQLVVGHRRRRRDNLVARLSSRIAN
ncbi:MAG: glycosyltransferase, partial [Gemmatimonadaceae bacterium]